MTIELHNVPLRDRAGGLVNLPPAGSANRVARAVEHLKSAANELYLFGTPEAVAWGEKIDALLGGGKDGRGPQPPGQGGLLEFLKGLE